MSEHRIRLRGGWIREPGNADEIGNSMVSLPMPALALDLGECRLSRSFGRPRAGVQEVVVLEMEHVFGLVRATLNGVTLPEVEDGKVEYVIGPGLLEERNRLMLEVDWERARAMSGSEWGTIALVIRSRETGA